MISTVQGTYPGLAWDITPEEDGGKISLPEAKIEVAGTAYQMAAASFDKSDGTVYLTPDGYSFVAKGPDDQSGQTQPEAELEKFPNGENYWIAHIEGDNIMALKAVKAE